MLEDTAQFDLRGQFGAALDGEPPLPDLVPDLVAAVRRGRRNRRLGTGAAGLALCLGVAGALPAGYSGSGSSAAGRSGARLIDVRTVGWSVEGYADGTVTLTVRELFDPDLLQKTLAEADIPSVVFPSEPMGMCGYGHTPPHFTKVVKTPFDDWMPGPLTVRGSDIPAGAELGFAALTVGSADVEAATFAVVRDDGAGLVC